MFRLFLIAVFLLISANLTYGQGVDVCGGRVLGRAVSANPNVGDTHFDAHPGPNRLADLSILGVAEPGYAPGDLRYAACVHTDLNGSATVGEFVAAPYVFELRGWAWNDNLGFISFACENGVNLSAANVAAGGACGDFDYGVYLAPPENGLSEVFGYAWNGSYGWLKFGGDCPYGPVTADRNGVVEGYACSDAGVPVPFNGMILEYANPVAGGNFLDSEGDDDIFLDEIFGQGEALGGGGGAEFGQFGGDLDGFFENGGGGRLEPLDGDWCEDREGVCLEIEPNPAALIAGVDAELERSLKIADGVDGYALNLYLRDENGAALNPADFENWQEFLNSIRLSWLDTVKLDQTRGAVGEAALAEVVSPFAGRRGAVNFKPVVFGDFEEIEPGHYRAVVTSYGPTSEANVSMTHTDPPYPFDNEQFVYDVGVPAIEEKNLLVLKRLTHGELRTMDGEVFLAAQPAFANGEVNVDLGFRPAIEVSDLFANAFEDAIAAIRNIPVNIRLEYAVHGELPNENVVAAQLQLNLAMDEEEQAEDFECRDAEFDFFFMSGLDPKAALDENVGRTALSQKIGTLDQGYPKRVIDLVAKASLRGNGEDICPLLKAPSLYSTISYSVNGRTIRYFSDKLPKVEAAVKNPAVVVHGNIQAQSVVSVSGRDQVRSSGAVNVSLVKNTVRRNIDKYFGQLSAQAQGVCRITDLNINASVKNGCKGAYKEVGGEKVIYIDGQNVYLELDREDLRDGEQWVIVVDRGNIFINKDVYAPELDYYLTLVAMRDRKNFATTGHVYIAGENGDLPAVKNLRATIIADGTLFSYDGDPTSIDRVNGEPSFGSLAERIAALNSQLLIEGSVYSGNTIGGGDIDNLSLKDYLLLGEGVVIEAPFDFNDRLRAQNYDLNYLRLFQLELETCENGLPVDQSCGKCLTFEDMLAIREGEVVCGEKEDCDPEDGGDQQCDGINPFERYLNLPGGVQSGDLIIPTDITKLSRGLDNGLSVAAGGRPADANLPQWEKKKDFEPVFVFFRPPNKETFLFN